MRLREERERREREKGTLSEERRRTLPLTLIVTRQIFRALYQPTPMYFDLKLLRGAATATPLGAEDEDELALALLELAAAAAATGTPCGAAEEELLDARALELAAPVLDFSGAEATAQSSHSTSSRSSTRSSPSSYSTRHSRPFTPRVADFPRAPPITTPHHHFPTLGLRMRMRCHRGSARSRATCAARSCSATALRFRLRRGRLINFKFS